MASISKRNLLTSEGVVRSWRPIIPDVVGRKVCLNRNFPQSSYMRGTVSSSLKSIAPEKIFERRQIEPFYSGVSRTIHEKHTRSIPHVQNISPKTTPKTSSKRVQFASDIVTNVPELHGSKSQRSLKSEPQTKKTITLACPSSSEEKQITPPLVRHSKKVLDRRISTTPPSTLNTTPDTNDDARIQGGRKKIRVVIPGNRKKKRKKLDVKKKKRLTRKVVRKTTMVSGLNLAKVKFKSDSIRVETNTGTKNETKFPQQTGVKKSEINASSANRKTKSISLASATSNRKGNKGIREGKRMFKSKNVQANMDNLPSLAHGNNYHKTVNSPLRVIRIEREVKQNARNLAAARKSALDLSRSTDVSDKFLPEQTLSMISDHQTAENNSFTEQSSVIDSKSISRAGCGAAVVDSKSVNSTGCESIKSLESVYLDEVRSKISKSKGKVAIEPSNISVVSHKTRSIESVFKERRLCQTRQQLGLSPLVTSEEASLMNKNDDGPTTLTKSSRKHTKSGKRSLKKPCPKATSLLMAAQLRAILDSYENHKLKEEAGRQKNTEKVLARSRSRSKSKNRKKSSIISRGNLTQE